MYRFKSIPIELPCTIQFESMEEPPNIRLQNLRKRKGFKSAADAARAFGWRESTYRSHENGTRDLSRNAARKYAAAFGCTIDELLKSHNGGPDYDNTVKRALAIRPLPRLAWGMVDGQALDQRIEQPESYSSVPGEIEVGNRAFVIDNQDDSMVDVEGRIGISFRPGNLLIIDPDKEITPGAFVIAEVPDSPQWVFRQYRVIGYENGESVVHLVPFNSSYPTYKLVGEHSDMIVGVLAGRLDTF